MTHSVAPPVPAGSSQTVRAAADNLFGTMAAGLPRFTYARASVSETGHAAFSVARSADGPWVGVGVGMAVRAADGDAVVRRVMERLTEALPVVRRTPEQVAAANRAHQASLNPMSPARARQLDALARGRRNRRTARAR